MVALDSKVDTHTHTHTPGLASKILSTCLHSTILKNEPNIFATQEVLSENNLQPDHTINAIWIILISEITAHLHFEAETRTFNLPSR